MNRGFDAWASAGEGDREQASERTVEYVSETAERATLACAVQSATVRARQ